MISPVFIQHAVKPRPSVRGYKAKNSWLKNPNFDKICDNKESGSQKPSNQITSIKKWIRTVGQIEMACGSNRVGGRKQEPV